MDHLWDSFSQELESAVIDDLKLNFNHGLDLETIQKQFLEQVRRLVIM